MKAFLSLTRLYLGSVYGLSFPKGKARPTLKQVAKTVGIVLLAAYMAAAFGAMFVLMNMAQYDALAPLGLQGMLILNAVITATMMTFVFGFLMALSTYWLNEAEDHLHALPIGPRSLLGAKLAMVWVSEAAVSLFVLGIAMVVYGIKAAPPAAFYVHGVLAALAVPLAPLALSYLVIILLMRVGRFLRNKNTLMLIGGIFGLVMALGFNILYQGMVVKLQDPAWVIENLGNPDAILARLGTAWPPSLFAYRAMSAPLAGSSALWTLANLALGLGAAALVVSALGPTFVASLRGFGERRFKRLEHADSFLATRLVAKPAFLTLFRREFVLMNREPMYLLNGPFIVVLMPLILGIMFVVQKDALAEEFGFLGALTGGSAGMLIAAGAAAFLGAGTSIACTAVSRDAKMLAGVKALPVSPAAYFLAKLAHAEVFGVFGAVVGAGIVGYALKLGAGAALLGGLVGLSFSTLVNLAGLYLDMAMPKLRWENPISALKQNINSVVVLLGAMALIGGLGYLSTQLALGTLAMAALYGGGSLALVAALLAAFPAWSRRRFAALEP